ncbi:MULTISPECIES: lectin OAA family protein [unclassified Microcoleus]|uniref:lectin OAA family protein n=1 Tax=unclassified Microcoleus TaxID=2642155 RepID=UPI002FCFC821
MTLYQVQNQWGGSSAPWNEGGTWVIGSRPNQNVVAINVKSVDGGQTLNGTMTYAGEGPIGFRATRSGSNTYTVENQWGGAAAPWNPGGDWVIGSRTNQNVVELNLKSDDGGKTLTGSMTYAGEGPIGFRATFFSNIYTVENQWGGTTAPWNPGGEWAIGGRTNQNVVAINVKSFDGGQTLNGTMTYAGEGPIGFRATRSDSNTYTVENQWGGATAPWNPGGKWVIGSRANQNVVELNLKSDDGGKTLTGSMTYAGEGPIGFKGQRKS